MRPVHFNSTLTDAKLKRNNLIEISKLIPIKLSDDTPRIGILKCFPEANSGAQQQQELPQFAPIGLSVLSQISGCDRILSL